MKVIKENLGLILFAITIVCGLYAMSINAQQINKNQIQEVR